MCSFICDDVGCDGLLNDFGRRASMLMSSWSRVSVEDAVLNECDPLWQDVLVSRDQDGIQEQLVVIQDEPSSLALAVDVRVVFADVQGDVVADDVCQAQQRPLDTRDVKSCIKLNFLGDEMSVFVADDVDGLASSCLQRDVILGMAACRCVV